MNVSCAKPDAALRQVNAAIDLLFKDGDPLAVRTLAAAGQGILADLLEHKSPGQSWRSHMLDSSGLTRKAAQKLMNAAQNFLKHADLDPTATLSFDEEENDHLLFMATLECGSLGHKLSLPMQAFQIWYLAAHPSSIGHESEVVVKSKQAFPHLESLPRRQQLACGFAFLRETAEKYANNA